MITQGWRGVAKAKKRNEHGLMLSELCVTIHLAKGAIKWIDHQSKRQKIGVRFLAPLRLDYGLIGRQTSGRTRGS